MVSHYAQMEEESSTEEAYKSAFSPWFQTPGSAYYPYD